VPRISTLTWGFPEGWIVWSPGEAAECAEELARALTADRATVAGLAAVIRGMDREVREEMPGTSQVALWAPDPVRREPVAGAYLRTMAPTPDGRRSLEERLGLARTAVKVPRSMRLLDVAALPSRVVAGEAVLQIIDTSPRFSRRVTRDWIWHILPEGTADTVRCEFRCESVAHFDELADITTDVANSVVVTLADA